MRSIYFAIVATILYGCAPTALVRKKIGIPLVLADSIGVLFSTHKSCLAKLGVSNHEIVTLSANTKFEVVFRESKASYTSFIVNLLNQSNELQKYKQSIYKCLNPSIEAANEELKKEFRFLSSGKLDGTVIYGEGRIYPELSGVFFDQDGSVRAPFTGKKIDSQQ